MRTYRALALGAASLVLVLSACGPGGSESPAGESQPGESQAATKPDVSVGSQTFWEAEVVGEMFAQALEAKGYTVERHLAISPERAPMHAAMDADEINLMVEYLGGLSGQGLGLDLSPDPQEAWDNLQEPLAEKGWVSFDFSPGTDADGFAVRQETADEFSLTTMTDLAAVADQLVWGVAEGCPENPVCGPGLDETYGIDLTQIDEAGNLEFLSACSTDIATALNDSAIDVAQVCTTQPEIAAMNLVLLEDDMHLQPAQNIVPIAKSELADAAPADFTETLNAITALLETDVLTQLGAQIVINQEDVADVAQQFLEDNGLL